MTAIGIERLEKHFGETIALRSLDLRIEPGELFFLLGPSGCGKTTLLRCIAGFYTPESGRITFNGSDVTRTPPHERNTGMVFQNYALWPHMTVAENVAFGLEERRVPSAERTKRVSEALESVHMAAYAQRKPAQLSGGQQQRVALARALVVRPSCLLLDEPLSNLDAKLRLEMRGEIRRVCKEGGLTAVYVTHDQKEALSIADRIAMMDGGRLMQVGAPRDIYARPVDATVASFMGETNFLAGECIGSENGRTLVRTDLGLFETTVLAPGFSPQTGAKCVLSIRPENWRITQMLDSRNSVCGRLVSTVYLGELAQLEISVGASVLKVSELNPRPRSKADIFLSVAPDDVVVLPTEKSS